jgi:hypothetical protein
MSSKKGRTTSTSATTYPNVHTNNGGMGDGGGGGATDPCDLTIDVDLEGVRAAALSGVSVGDTLRLDLDQQGGFPVAVCKRSDGTILGALSAFLSLSQLIRCLQSGVQFRVTVTQISSGSCHVFGGRVAL